jgi:hypothetical protein
MGADAGGSNDARDRRGQLPDPGAAAAGGGREHRVRSARHLAAHRAGAWARGAACAVCRGKLALVRDAWAADLEGVQAAGLGPGARSAVFRQSRRHPGSRGLCAGSGRSPRLFGHVRLCRDAAGPRTRRRRDAARHLVSSNLYGLGNNKSIGIPFPSVGIRINKLVLDCKSGDVKFLLIRTSGR